MYYIFLADGFEPIEALAPMDMLRRASIEVKSVGVLAEYAYSSNFVLMKTDISLADATFENLEGIILPGGDNGKSNLKRSKRVNEFIDYAFENNLLIAAICAAPAILAEKGLLDDYEATCFPFYKDLIKNYSDKYVLTDRNIITARGAGVATAFGLEIVKYVKGEAASMKIRDSIQWEK